jgi:hypothetical protein
MLTVAFILVFGLHFTCKNQKIQYNKEHLEAIKKHKFHPQLLENVLCLGESGIASHARRHPRRGILSNDFWTNLLRSNAYKRKYRIQASLMRSFFVFKLRASLVCLKIFAEKAGFEPAVPFRGTHAFQACLFNHSSISPCHFGWLISQMRLQK